MPEEKEGRGKVEGLYFPPHPIIEEADGTNGSISTACPLAFRGPLKLRFPFQSPLSHN